MSLELLLENWSDYDNKKIRGKEDTSFFSCDESWEVAYLKNKIKEVYPDLDVAEILIAIIQCCEQVKAPRPRKEFVRCVLRKLGKL